MGSILGIVGSARLWGNSELLVRQALAGAEREGASVALLRLTALRIESCTGCLRCVIGGKRRLNVPSKFLNAADIQVYPGNSANFELCPSHSMLLRWYKSNANGEEAGYVLQRPEYRKTNR